jgi:hypothetical protein
MTWDIDIYDALTVWWVGTLAVSAAVSWGLDRLGIWHNW